MKKWILLAAICSLPLQLMAQDDDMYFVPTKENVTKEAENYGMPRKTYYSGSNRSIDEYNGRLSSTVTPIDSMGQEVESDDYKYTRQLSRFDDYTPSKAYWEGYRDGRWNSPWYYGRYGWYSTWYDPWYASWYDPWYASWYDPWYYGGYYGWTSSWRYGWYSSYYYRPLGYYNWYTPIYYRGGRGHRSTAHDRFHANRNVSGSSAFGNGFGRARGGNNSSRGGFGNSRSSNRSTTTQNGTFGSSRNNSTGFGSRSSSSNSSSYSSSGSFGSNRSSGSSSGGSRGGSFGGGSRSGGGGGRFGR